MMLERPVPSRILARTALLLLLVAMTCLRGAITAQSEPEDDSRGHDSLKAQARGTGTTRRLEEWHVKTTTEYSSGGRITIDSPIGADDVAALAGAGESITLFLFLSRTDSYLPLLLDGWTLAASCFKSYNSQSTCWKAEDCRSKWSDGKYCSSFPSGNGKDLGTVVYYRTIYSPDDVEDSYYIRIRGSHPSWAILTALRGIDPDDPVHGVAAQSRDRTSDSLFPSVLGNAGDILLLSMAFDDRASRSDFAAPDDTDLLGYTSGFDEAGFLYGTVLSTSGYTGTYKTRGSGGSSSKDALIAMTLRKADGSYSGNVAGQNDKLLTTIAADTLVLTGVDTRADDEP